MTPTPAISPPPASADGPTIEAAAQALEAPEPQTPVYESPRVAQAKFLRGRYFGPLVLLLLTLRVIATCVWTGFLFPTGIDLSFPEGAVVARAYDAARGAPVYQDWREWPHAFAPYGPLTYYPVGWIARSLSKKPTPSFVRAVGRAQSIVCVLGLCALLALIAHRVGLPRAWVFVAVALSVDWEHPLTFIVSYRPDAAATMFSILALAVMMGGPPARARALGAFAALSTAMWFKPVAWGVVFAAGWWMARAVGRRRAALGMAAFAGANLAAALGLNYATRGHLFLNMIDSLKNGLNPTNVIHFYWDILFAPRAIYLVGLGTAFWGLIRGELDPRRKLLWVAIAASWVTATLENFKSGADVNYYVESYALASVAAAATAHAWWSGKAPVSAARREWVLCAFVVPMMIHDGHAGLRSIALDLKDVKRSWGEPEISRFVRKFDGEILAGNPFLAMARPDPPPTIMDFVQYKILVNRGKIDVNIVLRKLRNQDFDAIIFAEAAKGQGGWFPDQVMTTALENYEVSLAVRAPSVTVLLPKTQPGFPRAGQARRPGL